AQERAEVFLLHLPLGLLPPLQVDGLADGHQRQEPPQVVAVVQPREAAALRAEAEALEGAEGDVLVVAGQATLSAEARRGQRDQPLEVAFEQQADRLAVASLELLDPESNTIA